MAYDNLNANLGGTLTFGVPGASAYEVAVKNGFKGTVLEWLDSLQGHTPQKGQDYFTDTDKQEIVDEVVAQVGSTGSVQPDLSQNDPEAADYVKGVIRQESLPEGYPYKTKTENVILPETEFTTVDNDGLYGANSEATGELIIGNTYNVTLNGDKYTCVAYDANLAPAIGNGKLVGGDDTGEPFFFAFTNGMAVLFTESADTYIISVKETAESYSKIDENYMPDSVAGSPIEFIVSEDGTSVSCDLSSEELLSLSVHDLQKRCVLVDGSMKLIPQSIATGTLTSAHGYHTTITFAETYCSSVNAIVRDPVYVVISENGDLKYITATEFKEADIVRTATPGQTIVVKAVDDAGKPTEWEAVDLPVATTTEEWLFTLEDGSTVTKNVAVEAAVT